jgi:hypothetical protein
LPDFDAGGQPWSHETGPKKAEYAVISASVLYGFWLATPPA